MKQTLAIDSHASVCEQAMQVAAIESLQGNQIGPKFLYTTTRQADLWRQVFLKHSPIHANPGFARIYRDAFARVLHLLKPGKLLLVGLGCGTGSKEMQLFADLKAGGHEAQFVAIDVSRDLVVESTQKLIDAGAGHDRSLVCDLAQSAYLREWLDDLDDGLPRLITFFGLVPNLPPSVVIDLFRSILRRGDILLVSAHLAPVEGDNPNEIPAAMELVLPQYKNPETLAWLSAALEEWGLEELVGPPEMKIGQVEGVPAFIATSNWKTCESFEKWGHRFTPRTEPLRLFHSFRHTPALFEEMLNRAGFNAQRLAITPCRQEAIWCIRRF